MQNLVNKNIVLLDENIFTVDALSQYTSGKFRHIVKTKLGMTCCDARGFDNERMMKHPESAISGYNRGALQTVEFQPEGSSIWLTIFSRTGKKVKLIDETILANLTVGTINGMYDTTNLMCMHQYKAVKSKSWASMAFVMNNTKVAEVA